LISFSGILTALLFFMAIAPGTGAARAASGDILVSLDGENWSSTLTRGLYFDVGTVMPGESISRTLWIKNATSAAATLRLSRIQTAATSSLFARAISISATGRGTGGSSRSPQDGSCVKLLPDQVVLAGPLASTGAGLQYPAIMVASLFTGLGLFVVLAARRRRRAE
jgi:hypothetical protein